MKLNKLVVGFSLALLIGGLNARASTFSENRFKSAIKMNAHVAKKIANGIYSPVAGDLYKSLDQADGTEVSFFKLSPMAASIIVEKGSLRNTAFQLQALARIYRDYPVPAVQSVVEVVFRSAKREEDLVGEFDKWYSFDSNSPKAVAAANELVATIFGFDLTSAGIPLTERPVLNEAGETKALDVLTSLVSQAPWLDSKTDRDYVLQAMADTARLVQTKDYANMTLLEGGLHELRRDLRWLPISAVGLSGLIQTKDEGAFACQQSNLNFAEKGEADKRYSLDPFSQATEVAPEEVCYVSRCLYNELVGAVAVFGDLKDYAEPFVLARGITESDFTPNPSLKDSMGNPEPDLVTPSYAQYKNLIDSEAAEKLAQQIEACKK